MELSKETERKIIDLRARKFEADEIRHILVREEDLAAGPSVRKIRKFCEQDRIQREIDVKKRVKRKKAGVGKEDLVETLVDLKEDLETWQTELKDTEHGVTRNEAVGNIVDVVNKIGELVGELDRGGSGTPDNVIKIDEVTNNIEQNFVEVVEHLPSEKKTEIVKQLEADDDIEDFAIVRKN